MGSQSASAEGGQTTAEGGLARTGLDVSTLTWIALLALALGLVLVGRSRVPTRSLD